MSGVYLLGMAHLILAVAIPAGVALGAYAAEILELTRRRP